MDASQLSNVILSGSVATSTLRENILAELDLNPNPDWGYLLKHLSMAFKQLETMKGDVHPSFQLVDVVPQNGSLPMLPDLLGTAVSAEDSALLTMTVSEAVEQISSDEIDRHNKDMRALLDALFGSDEQGPVHKRSR